MPTTVIRLEKLPRKRAAQKNRKSRKPKAVFGRGPVSDACWVVDMASAYGSRGGSSRATSAPARLNALSVIRQRSGRAVAGTLYMVHDEAAASVWRPADAFATTRPWPRLCIFRPLKNN